MPDKKKIRASLVELFTRIIKVDDKNKDIYINGEDNLYPYEIERVINNSPTASRSALILKKFIAGNGVEKDTVVNKSNKKTLSQIVTDIADDIAYHGGSFLWVGWGFNSEMELVPNKLEVLNYADCRISKEDNVEYPGKIYVKRWDKKEKFGKKEKMQWYYPFNSNAEAVKSQMQNDMNGKSGDMADMIRNYRGQVYFINPSRYKYPLSRFDSVYNDMDSEFRFSLYTNTQFRNGFLGKVAVVFRGLDDQQEKEQKKNVASWIGSENSGDVYFLNVDSNDSIDEIMKVIQTKPQFDDKLFEANERRIRRNIMGAANNIPEPLVNTGDGALFGTSGETFDLMRQFYNEQTSAERKLIESSLEKIGFDVKIIPLI